MCRFLVPGWYLFSAVEIFGILVDEDLVLLTLSTLGFNLRDRYIILVARSLFCTNLEVSQDCGTLQSSDINTMWMCISVNSPKWSSVVYAIVRIIRIINQAGSSL